MLKIDGSYLEGGGQIIRTALALSTLAGTPFEADNIRKGRRNPGLKAQHLHCIKALEQLCNARTEGAALGSECIRYWPGKIDAKEINVDIGTAGSIGLLLQSVLLPCAFADKKIKLALTGGTDGKWAMPYDYFLNVLLPQIKRYANIECSLKKRGYYPKGGGKVELDISQKYKICDFSSFDDFYKHLRGMKQGISLIEQGSLAEIKGVSHASTILQKANVAERQAAAAEAALKRLNCPVRITKEYDSSLSAGSGITLAAGFSGDGNNPVIVGADALGEPGKKAEAVGNEAAQNMIKEIESKAPVDSHLADNLIPFIGLFGGKINVSSITGHTRTNIYVVERFLNCKFIIDEKNKTICC